MRLLRGLVFGLIACGAPPPPPPLDAGAPLPGEDVTLPFTELPPETLAFTCREIVGGAFVSVDPADPRHFRAETTNVALRSDDEGRTWTRSPVETGFVNVFLGPLVIGYARTEPYRFNERPLSVSLDRGLTWRPLTFTSTTDPSLPPGSALATLGSTRIAWTATGRLLASFDGGGWTSEPNSFLQRGGDDVRVALGNRVWFLDAAERQLFRSRDLGRTWQALPFRAARRLELLGESTVVASGGLISRDDGDTWTRREGLSDAFAVGPADGELWFFATATGTEQPRLLHSRDFGASFAPVMLSLGLDGTVTELATARVFATADGRRVLEPRINSTTLNRGSRLVCVETTGPGTLLQAIPAKDDAPGTATLWATGRFGFARDTLQQVVPLRTPGRAFGITSRTFDDTYLIRGGTRLPGGGVALLLQPVPELVPTAGPPMRVHVLDGETLAEKRRLSFTSLLDDTPQQRTRYLESKWLQALPDGGLRTDTAEGDYPLGVEAARWVPWRSNARWGRAPGGAEQVTFELVEATRFFRRIRSLSEGPVFCAPDAGVTERCLPYAGKVQDWAVRDGRVYVLDDWRGEVLEANAANLDGVWRPILTGLASPTSLLAPVDDDPGLYVVDTHLYRVVPGSMPARRP
jgi:photosystem II stability/assembly factor-like uncharacterized protein